VLIEALTDQLHIDHQSSGTKVTLVWTRRAR
jgi:hypothetical protein